MISAGAVKTYDPSQVHIIFGPLILTGYADGTFVNVNRKEDMFSLQIGTSGEGTRSKSNNRSGEVMVQLMQSSDSNAALSELALADEIGNVGVFPLFIKDNSGSSIYTAETAWIVKIPDSEFSREAGPREWKFETDVLVAHVGGN